jgi:hypothetical protein
MKVETESWVANRIGQIETYAQGTLVRRVPGATLDEQDPAIEAEHEATSVIVPQPRRAAVFLRHGEGHGRFAELTITHPGRG